MEEDKIEELVSSIMATSNIPGFREKLISKKKEEEKIQSAQERVMIETISKIGPDIINLAKFLKVKDAVLRFIKADFDKMKNFYLENRELINDYIKEMNVLDNSSRDSPIELGFVKDDNFNEILSDFEFIYHVYHRYLGYGDCGLNFYITTSRLPSMSSRMLLMSKDPYMSAKEYYQDPFNKKCESILSRFDMLLNEISMDIRSGNKSDLEVEFKDGFPMLRRWIICESYIPVIDMKNLIKGDVIALYNPRSKVEFEYEVLDVLSRGEDVHDRSKAAKVRNIKTQREIFLIDYSYTASTFDDLAPINKAIHGGWWNKKLYLV